jgi:hypothetical protein
MQISLDGARVERTSEGQAFFFEEHYGFAYVLNECGARLVELLLSGDRSQEELMSCLLADFDTSDRQVVERDVQLFLEQLRVYGLLE